MNRPDWFTKAFIEDAKAVLAPYVEGAEINNQDITITENGEYQAEDGYTGLGTVTVDVDGPEYDEAEGASF